MALKHKQNTNQNKTASERFTAWIGSPVSIIVHTIVFAAAFVFVLLGAPLNTVLLVLTTAVSLEAIYLALFIQMSVNKNTQSLADVEVDIEEIAEDVEGIEKDIDEIQLDVDKLEEDEAEDDLHDAATMKTLNELQAHMQKIMAEIQALKEQKK
jgi:septal ring factor EnvC (AmiA/AmiB activator)